MTTDTTAYQLHKTTAATLPAQWAWQMGGTRLGGVGVDWDTGHVNFNLRGRGEREKWLVYIYTLIFFPQLVTLFYLISLSFTHTYYMYVISQLTGQCSCTTGVSEGLSFGRLSFTWPKENCFDLMGLARRGPDCCWGPDDRERRLEGGGLPSGGREGRSINFKCKNVLV